MVIAILAILAALLVPSLNVARRRAREVQCMNNLRQLGSWGLMYAGENEDALPRNEQPSSTTGWYDGPRWSPWYTKAAPLWQGANARVSALHCPEAMLLFKPWLPTGTAVSDRGSTSYSLNQFLGGYRGYSGSPSPSSPESPTTKDLTPQKFWFGDGCISLFSSVDPSAYSTFLYMNANVNNDYWPSWPWKHAGRNAGHPGDSALFVFGDGHVEAIPHARKPTQNTAAWLAFTGSLNGQ